jgi:hypothetical protein
MVTFYSWAWGTESASLIVCDGSSSSSAFVDDDSDSSSSRMVALRLGDCGYVIPGESSRSCLGPRPTSGFSDGDSCVQVWYTTPFQVIPHDWLWIAMIIDYTLRSILDATTTIKYYGDYLTTAYSSYTIWYLKLNLDRLIDITNFINQRKSTTTEKITVLMC